MLTAEQNKKSKGPVQREAGVQGGEGGPCRLQLPGWPDLGKKLALMSDLPSLTHTMPAQLGAPPRDRLLERPPSLGSSFFMG